MNGLGRALVYIESNLFSPLRTVDVAKRAGMSVAGLFRHFQRDVGMTPFDYQRARPLDTARRLLEEGGHSVTDAALLVGYNDLSAFSKAFKIRFGGSPSSFLPTAGGRARLVQTKRRRAYHGRRRPAAAECDWRVTVLMKAGVPLDVGRARPGDLPPRALCRRQYTRAPSN
jgi:AraC-like DNA-binding protein